MKKVLAIISLALILATHAGAQLSLTPSVLASGGNYHETDNISISWTIGELAITTLTGENLILTQGFQQPNIIGVGIANDKASQGIFVYPNPVKDELRMRFDIDKPNDYMLEIQDVTGRIFLQTLQKSVNPDDIILINTSNLVPGIYFLKVQTADGQTIETTSIVKTQ